MEEREENPHERLKQQLSELEQEWTAMKMCKSSSAVSWITVEEALGFVDNSPRKLMLSLQQDQACPEAEMIQIRSPLFRRKLFHGSDDDSDERKASSFSHSSCWSSNVMRVRDDKKKKKTRGKAVSVTVALLLFLVLVVLTNGFDHLSMNRKQIDTLVPT